MFEATHMPVSTMDFGGMAELRARAGRQQDAETRREVAAQFEALFVQMMLKSMRDAMPGDELFGSNQMEMYQEMHDKQLAMEISRGSGLGLARMIEAQLQAQTLGEDRGATQVSGPPADIPL